MPQHEVGYRPWSGKKTSQASRWWIIAETGFQSALKSTWVKRILFVAWLPIFYWGTIFFVLENALVAPNVAPQPTEAEWSSSETDQETRQQFDTIRDRLGLIREQLETPRGKMDRRQKRNQERQIQFLAAQIIDELRTAKQNNKGNEIVAREINHIQQEVVLISQRTALEERFGWVPGSDVMINAMSSNDLDKKRHVAWSLLLMTFFRYPQATMIIFLLGFIAPGLISRDLRSRAYLIYFSKPIGRMEYIFGKLAIPAVFLLLVTTLPALCLYALGVSLSPDLSVVASTWDIPFRIILASVVLIIPTACLSLMLSSLTSESRFATFAWFAVWVLGHGAWMGVWVMQGVRTRKDPMEALEDPIVNGWSSLSLYNNLGNVQSWIFGLTDFNTALPGMIVLSLIAVFSLFILFRRVSAPIRV
jgi:hypothetical protein